MVADVLLNSIVNLKVFLEISLLSKPHAAALLLALEWLVLGVAPQVCEELAQGRDHTGAPFEVADKDFELSFRGSALDVVHCEVFRAGYVSFVV